LNHDPEKALKVANTTTDSSAIPPLRGLSFLDRFLVLWILLAMVFGILLGNFHPETATALNRGEFTGVSIPIGKFSGFEFSNSSAIGLLVMMYPILCKVKYETLHLLLRERKLWIQIGISFVLNWIIAPLLMLGLAWAFLPDRPELRQGLIYVGVARCIAMVLIWTDLAGGDGDYCAILVAFNSILQMVLFAPLAILYVDNIGGSEVKQSLDVDYRNIATSVAIFLGIPLAAAILTRFILIFTIGSKHYTTFLRIISPLSLLGLIFTIIILFASQGLHAVQQITSVLRVIPPLIVYFIIMFGLTLYICRRFKIGYRIACAQSFTAASNNFELAIAVVVSVYGIGSEQALASTVGPLIEVPVLLVLVYLMKYLKKRWGWEL
jgi:ACR3 family arsenite transporter